MAPFVCISTLYSLWALSVYNNQFGFHCYPNLIVKASLTVINPDAKIAYKKARSAKTVASEFVKKLPHPRMQVFG